MSGAIFLEIIIIAMTWFNGEILNTFMHVCQIVTINMNAFLHIFDDFFNMIQIIAFKKFIAKGLNKVHELKENLPDHLNFLSIISLLILYYPKMINYLMNDLLLFFRIVLNWWPEVKTNLFVFLQIVILVIFIQILVISFIAYHTICFWHSCQKMGD